jgi:hypothetical protein
MRRARGRQTARGARAYNPRVKLYDELASWWPLVSARLPAPPALTPAAPVGAWADGRRGRFVLK